MGLAILPQTFKLEQYRGVNYSFLLAWKPRPTILQSAAHADYPWGEALLRVHNRRTANGR